MTALHPADERFEDAPCPLCGERTAHEVVRGTDRLRPGDLAAYVVARCDACGLAYTKPRPTPAAMGGFYPPSYSGAGGGGLIDRIEAFYRDRQQREALRWLAELRPRRGSVLDVGCGRGDLLLALRGDGWKTYGLEPSPEGVLGARTRGLDVTRGRFEDLTAGPSAFDVVVFSGVLEHLHDPLGSLQKSRMSLAPGVSSPCCSCRCWTRPRPACSARAGLLSTCRGT